METGVWDEWNEANDLDDRIGNTFRASPPPKNNEPDWFYCERRRSFRRAGTVCGVVEFSALFCAVLSGGIRKICVACTNSCILITDTIRSSEDKMSISTVDVQPLAVDVVCSSDAIQVELADGREISVPLEWYPRLLDASPMERNNWTLIGGGLGIHWETLDEDVSVESLLRLR